MKRPPFVPLDKRLAATLKTIRREYSDIEAAFSYSLDVNCGKVKSLRAYSRMWSWSVGRVKRFLNDPDRGGAVTEQQRSRSGTAKPPKSPEPQNKAEQQRNSSGTEAEHNNKEQEQEQRKDYTPSFDSFWKMYPRKIGKKKAFEAWQKANCENGILQDVLKGAEQYAKYVSSENTEQKFIAHPTTWINQERWTDEYSSSSSEQEYFDPFKETPLQ